MHNKIKLARKGEDVRGGKVAKFSGRKIPRYHLEEKLKQFLGPCRQRGARTRILAYSDMLH